MGKFEIMAISAMAVFMGDIIAKYLQEKFDRKYPMTEKTKKKISFGILIFLGIIFIVIIVHSLYERTYIQ